MRMASKLGRYFLENTRLLGKLIIIWQLVAARLHSLRLMPLADWSVVVQVLLRSPNKRYADIPNMRDLCFRFLSTGPFSITQMSSPTQKRHLFQNLEIKTISSSSRRICRFLRHSFSTRSLPHGEQFRPLNWPSRCPNQITVREASQMSPLHFLMSDMWEAVYRMLFSLQK